ncbi:hypothetical protein [Tahibacter aquaticus]|jgi:hypothetical protein|uniref:hypothetical protein n=1 Tax=Tahibacter aquaticus TaxID=520092 RepID=UPI0010614720|nr:hypothetical protein [Tahibacter aquaticus]
MDGFDSVAAAAATGEIPEPGIFYVACRRNFSSPEKKDGEQIAKAVELGEKAEFGAVTMTLRVLMLAAG